MRGRLAEADAVDWLWFLALGLAAVLAAGLAAAAVRYWRRGLPTWLPDYWRGRRRRQARPAGPIHLLFAVADHWEPLWRQADAQTAQRRVAAWVREYPRAAGAFRDADGFPPQHTWFYPYEQYVPEHVEALAALARDGWGETEVHLHHHGETPDRLADMLRDACRRLAGHGLLCTLRGEPHLRYAFVHGNWALCNSRPDGQGCGVNDELAILRQTGCYADLTMPSALRGTQTRKVNSLYYARQVAGRPKSHDTGVDAAVGRPASGDLLCIQGPLALDWSRRKWGLLPRVENAELSADNPPRPERVDLWVRQGIGVIGRPEWVFIKLHTHGCVEANWPVCFGDGFRQLHEDLARRYNDGRRYVLHYVTARHMANIIRAAEDGHSGDPNAYRDYALVSRIARPSESGR